VSVVVSSAAKGFVVPGAVVLSWKFVTDGGAATNRGTRFTVAAEITGVFDPGAGSLDGLPNMDRILASAICAADTIVIEVFGVRVFAVSGAVACCWGNARVGELRSRPIRLTNAGVARVVFAVGTGVVSPASRFAWLVPVVANAFTGRTNAGQCPKSANLNSVT
jgi:hypothetical protein